MTTRAPSTVRELMTTELVTLPPTAPLADALTTMAQRGVRHLPVVDGATLVGVASDRDVLAACGGSHEAAKRHRIGDVMSSPVVTVAPDDTLVMASTEMSLRRIGCVPVVDGELLGVLTETDLIRAYVEVARTFDERERALSDPEVGALMSSHPETVDRTEPLSRALELARERDFRHIPVVAHGRLVGILSDRDLCREIGLGTPGSTRVADAMTGDVVTARTHERVSAAAERMLARRISGLPVLREDELVGVLSTTDLVEHCPRGAGLLREAFSRDRGSSAARPAPRRETPPGVPAMRATPKKLLPALTLTALVPSIAAQNCLVQSLQQGDAETIDYFGASVAVSDGRMLVGAPYEDEVDADAGSVYAFEFGAGGSFVPTQKLTASDALAGDAFGSELEMEGRRSLRRELQPRGAVRGRGVRLRARTERLGRSRQAHRPPTPRRRPSSARASWSKATSCSSAHRAKPAGSSTCSSGSAGAGPRSTGSSRTRPRP